MKKSSQIILLAIALMVQSCKNDEKPIGGAFESKNFIQVYRSFDDISLIKKDNTFLAEIVGPNILQGEKGFDVIANSNKDETYNSILIPATNFAVKDQILSIGVVTITDYNDEYKASHDISDNVIVTFSTPCPFIESGYVLVDDRNTKDQIISPSIEYFEHTKRLTELTRNDLNLCNIFLRFSFIEECTVGNAVIEFKFQIENKEIIKQLELK